MGIEKIIEKIKRPLSIAAIASSVMLFSTNYAQAEEVARYDTNNTPFMMIEARIMQATDCGNVDHQLSEIQKYSAKMNPITIRVLEDMKTYCSSGYADCNLSGGQTIHLRCWPDGSGHPISSSTPKPKDSDSSDTSGATLDDEAVEAIILTIRDMKKKCPSDSKLTDTDYSGNSETEEYTADGNDSDSSNTSSNVPADGDDGLPDGLDKDYYTNKCFVATTIYGNPHAPQVEKLREFRDNTLSKSYLGQKFIEFYYGGAGKSTANFIEKHLSFSIPYFRKGLDFLVDRIDSDKHQILTSVRRDR